MHKIQGLEGEYCEPCTESLLSSRANKYSLVVMCRECLDKLEKNGDYERVVKMIEEKEKQHA